MTEFEPFTVESGNTHIRRLYGKMRVIEGTTPTRRIKLRFPLMMLGKDKKILLQGMPIIPDDESTDRLVLPVKSTLHLREKDTFDSILTEHVSSHMVLANRQIPFLLFSFGYYRTFSSDSGELPTDVTTIPGIVLFNRPSDEVGFRYRYQEKYGELSWHTIDEANDLLRERASIAGISKAVVESAVLVDMLHSQMEG
jgi:hypothetical protein